MAVLCLGCGGLIHGQNGTVSSPQWPAEYPPNTECLWEIIVPAGYHIIAQFNDSFFGLQADCQDYVEVSETGMAYRLFSLLLLHAHFKYNQFFYQTIRYM